MPTAAPFIRVASLEELKSKGVITVRGADRPIAVFADKSGAIFAVDNRCPHMGFPLNRGTCDDGMITCPWHNARFDGASGCTFDLFADDVPAFDIEMRGSEVWVAPHPRAIDAVSHARRRLREGMEQDLSLICNKAITTLSAAGIPHTEIIRDVALYGARYRDSWGPGLTSLTAVANLLRYLSHETALLALFQATSQIAGDCAARPPRRDRYPLDAAAAEAVTLKRWLRYWVMVRHRDAAERTLLTAIRQSTAPEETGELVFTALTDRAFANIGHPLDFSNKAFELLGHIGWQDAATVLPTLVADLCAARGGEESNAWRHPIDLVALMQPLSKELPALLETGRGKHEAPNAVNLASRILVDDPRQIVEALKEALGNGAQPAVLSRAVVYAAALRIARFGTGNEIGDWFGVQHTFSYCNALHQAIQRLAARGPVPPEILRGVFHGAMAVYLDRFLNVPPAVLPGERRPIDDEPRDAAELLAKLLGLLDSRNQVEECARVVARYAALGHPIPALIDTLVLAIVREDFDFHTLQVLEAAVRLHQEFESGSDAARNVLIAAVRNIAAHSPTQRASFQTATIALRLHRGEKLYEEES